MSKKKGRVLPSRVIILSLTLTAVFFLLFSCSDKNKPSVSNNGKKTVLCSFYPIYIMAKNIVKDVPGIELKNLTPFAVGCLHDYSLTPADRLAIDRAPLLIVNGFGMENFLDKLMAQKTSKGLKVIFSSAGIIPLVDKATGQTNAHVWVSMENAVLQTSNIAEGLAAFDPANAVIYRRNAASYIRSLETLGVRMRTQLKGKTSPIVTFHEAFPYFAKELGLTIAAVVEREPGSEPGAREMADTVRLIRNLKVKAVFAEPQYSPKAAETIGRETGVPVYNLDPAVTGPDADDAYIRIMEKNLAVLKEALK